MRRRRNQQTPAQAKRARAALMKEIAREIKSKDRARLLELRERLRRARRQRAIALREAKTRCTSRKPPSLAAVRADLRRRRAEAKSACALDKAHAKTRTEGVARARAELAAERTYQKELRRIEAGNRAARLAARPGLARSRTRRGESDDEVRGNIPPELVALFNRVKGQIRADDRQTRTEAFLAYAEAHPDEEWQALEASVDRTIAELERRQAMPNPKKKKKRRKARKASGKRPKRRAAPKKKNTAARRRAPKRRAKKRRARSRAPSTRQAFERLASSSTVRGSVTANAAYWRLAPAARLAFVRKLRRGSARSRRAAVLLAKAECAKGGPPRHNPGMSDAAAKDEYSRTHWGLRGKGRVSRGRAPDPSHGTLTKMGRLVSVVYETKKRGDRGPTEYEHEFEGTRPTLAYNDGGLVVVGGTYRVKAGGIDG
jgi:hypothetical protein